MIRQEGRYDDSTDEQSVPGKYVTIGIEADPSRGMAGRVDDVEGLVAEFDPVSLLNSYIGRG